MLLHQGISSQGGHSRLQRLRGDRGQPVQSAHLTHHHTHKQAGPTAKHLLQRPPVSIVMAAGAVSSGGGSGEAKKPANLCLHQGQHWYRESVSNIGTGSQVATLVLGVR